MNYQDKIKNKIIDEFKSWKGTKWVHGQSCKGAGVDCVQLLVAGFKSLGLLPPIFKTIKYNQDYALHNSTSVLLLELKKHCHLISLDQIKAGDILVYKYDKTAHHTAVYIGNKKIIHSKIRQGVIESYLSDEQKNFVSAWRLNSFE